MSSALQMATTVVFAALIWVCSGGAAAVDIATVAKTGDLAPGAGGATFTTFSFSPALNGAGEVAFPGNLSDGGQGTWLGGPAGLALVAKSGDVAPGAGGATFLNFLRTVVNSAGEVAFIGCFNVGCTDRSIWLGGPAGLALVAKSGDVAPDAGGATFTAFNNPVVNGAGEVAFLGFLSDGGRGIWLGGPAGLALLARTGDAAPGAGGPTFTLVGSPVLNGAGEVAFDGELSGGGEGIWRSGPAGLALVVKSGGLAPGAGGATFTLFGSPVLNGAGEVAFFGNVSGGGSGIWLGGPAGLALVAKTGDVAPGAGGAAFTSIRTPVLNGAGEVAFVGDLSDGGEGIWEGDPASLALIAKTGDAAPGAGGPTFTAFNSPVLNGAGEVAFGAELTGSGATAANDFGLWAGPRGGLQLIAREGDAIEVAPSDVRTVTDGGLGFFARTGNEDGRFSGFSEGGQVVFLARFIDTSEGIFLGPPEAPTVHRVPYRAVDGAWDQVMLPRSFAKAVIIAGPPGSANKQPGVVRLREIQGAEGRFEAQFQEWRYLDGPHPEERAAFLVLEMGRHKQSDGSIWEAGRVKVKGNRKWKKTRFTKRFRRPPEVFVTLQSFKGKTAVAARVRNVTRKGFEVSIQEEEKDLAGTHPKETVGYLAVYSRKGRGTIAGGVDGTDYRLKQTKVKHRFKKVLGGAIKLEEEKSKGRETRHKKEAVSVLSLGQGLFAQQASDKEADTTAIRRR